MCFAYTVHAPAHLLRLILNSPVLSQLSIKYAGLWNRMTMRHMLTHRIPVASLVSGPAYASRASRRAGSLGHLSSDGATPRPRQKRASPWWSSLG